MVKKGLFILSLLIAAVMVTACGGSTPVSETKSEDTSGSEHHEDESDHHANEMDEHHPEEAAHAHVETPEEFRDMRNPLAGNAEAIAAGQEIYEASCVPCHGSQGAGDGPAAAALDPQPVDLADAPMMQAHGDGYVFWRVSKGGAMDPFNSAMLAYESTLSEEEIWQVISYVRTFSKD